MKITNKNNLPPALVQLISRAVRKPSPTEVHVTELIQPPKIAKLRLQHWEELTEDASDLLWAFYGSAAHKVMEEMAGPEDLVEKAVSTKVGGITIVGRLDLFTNITHQADGIHGDIQDWKTTSAYGFMRDRSEWDEQLNIYAYCMEEQGYHVDHLTINAFLKDFKPGNVDKIKDYPKNNFVTKDIPLWTHEQQRRFIEEKVRDFTADIPRDCTDEEMWVRGGPFAIVQAGKKRAVKVLSQEERQHVVLQPGQHLETRKPEYTRCASYCPVRNVCKQGLEHTRQVPVKSVSSVLTRKSSPSFFERQPVAAEEER
jgi:hypothetical protein